MTLIGFTLLLTVFTAVHAWQNAPTQQLVLSTPAAPVAAPPRTLRRGLVVLAALVAVVVGQAVPLIVAGLVYRLWVVLAKRRQAQARQHAISAQLAETIDLFAVALASGHNLASATEQVGRWSQGELGDQVRACLRQAEQGLSLADAFEQLPTQLGNDLRPLAAALVAHERYGAPISATLTRLADDVRVARRRRGEMTARQLPVVMLFPLVTCILPAFVLLTVVPVMADSLSSFQLFASLYVALPHTRLPPLTL